MNWLKAVRSWFGKKKTCGDLTDELRFHLEKEVELNVSRGMSLDEARRRALVSFGGVQQTRENVSQVRWTHWLEILAQDTRYGFRMLRKNPGLTTIAVLTLALGIGMNTAIFSLIDAVLFRALPAKAPEELVLLRWHAGHKGKIHSHRSNGDCRNHRHDGPSDGCEFSLPFFNLLREQKDVFAGLAAYSGAERLNLSGNGAATIVNHSLLVSGEYFATLGTRAALGRLLQASDDDKSAPPVLVLSNDYWRGSFGAAPDVVGRVVRLNGVTFTIVGVAEPGFNGLTPGHKVDLWMPLAEGRRISPHWTAEDDDGGSWWLVIVARRNHQVSDKQAKAAVSVLYANETMHEQKPIFNAADAPGVDLVSAQRGLSGAREDILPPLYILMMAVALVLLIACANIAGLLLARAAGRAREIAVRLTLGARRSRLISQLLVESLLLSILGGAVGLLFAQWGARGLLVLFSQDGSGPLPLVPRLDTPVLAFTAMVAVLTGIVFGLVPAFRSLRIDLTPALKSGSTGSEVASRSKWYSMGNVLVVAQVSLAIVALMVAGLLVRTLRNLKSVDLGFDSNKLLVFALDPTLAGYKGARVDAVFRDLQEQIAALPGVQTVTYSWTALLSGWGWDTGFHAPGTPDKQASDAAYMPVGPHFFESMHIPFKSGRDFNAADFSAAAAKADLPPGAKPDPNAPPIVVIVNETFVRRFYPRTNPIGQHVEEVVPDDPDRPRGSGWLIIGVVGDARYETLRGEVNPTMYAASAGNAWFSVRASGDPLSLVPAIRDLVNRKDSNLAMSRIATEEQQIDRLVSNEKLVARLSTFFGLLALVLACTGIYGLLSYEVTRRTREIGIRVAIGAQQIDVLRLVIAQGLGLAVVGGIIGGAASLVVKGLVQSILYKVSVGDPLTMVAVGGVLFLVALAACYMPARRATRVDPLVALRYE
jgi:predicted permease